MLISALLLSFSGALAGPLGPGIPVRQVVAPPQVVATQSIRVTPLSGPGGAGVAAEVAAQLTDAEREVGMGTVGDVASSALKAGAKIGGDMLAAKLGGGFAGKLVGGLAEGTANVAAGAIESDKLQLDDGLTTTPFRVVQKGGDAALTGSVAVAPSTESYTKKVQATDSDGQPLTDSDGKAIMREVSCQRRSVTATVSWAVEQGGAALASGESPRTMSDSHCAGDDGALASTQSLTDAAVVGHGAVIVAQIGPAWRVSRIDLQRSSDLRLPLGQIRQGDHAGALCMLHHVSDLLPDDADAPTNEAAVLEALGHYDAALATYDLALSRGGGRVATQGRERAAARKSEVEGMVAAYGLDWKIGPPPLDACPDLPDGRPALVKKKQSDRTDAPAGAVLDTLERGDRVFIMEEQDGLSRVQLLDGSEGWVSTKDLK
jgi:hypothetical protein